MTELLKCRENRLGIWEMDYPHWDRIEEGRHVGYLLGRVDEPGSLARADRIHRHPVDA